MPLDGVSRAMLVVSLRWGVVTVTDAVRILVCNESFESCNEIENNYSKMKIFAKRHAFFIMVQTCSYRVQQIPHLPKLVGTHLTSQKYF